MGYRCHAGFEVVKGSVRAVEVGAVTSHKPPKTSDQGRDLLMMFENTGAVSYLRVEKTIYEQLER